MAKLRVYFHRTCEVKELKKSRSRNQQLADLEHITKDYCIEDDYLIEYCERGSILNISKKEAEEKILRGEFTNL